MLNGHVTWRYTPPHDKKVYIIYLLNDIFVKDPQRFRVDRQQKGVNDLSISNLHASDEGVYECRETEGQHPGKTCTELIIRGKVNFTSEQTEKINHHISEV